MLTEFFINVGVVLALVLFFGMSIFIHEFGHFIVARWCGLVVEVFSIGFGPAIWKKRVNGVLYKVGIFPLGGYVALPQLDPTGMSRVQGESDGDGEAPAPLPAIEPWKKILVSIAGAVGNIILAVVLAWIVYLVGMPAGPAERSSIVGYVETQSEAYADGLRTGDRIVRVNDIQVQKWGDFRLESALHNESVEVEALGPDGLSKVMSLSTDKGFLGEQKVPGVFEPTLCVIMKVAPGQSAEKAGLKPNDTITHFAGEVLLSRRHMSALVTANKGKRQPITVKRFEDGEWISVDSHATPEFDAKVDLVRIGITWNDKAVDHDTVVHPKPMEQLREHSSSLFRFLGALVQPKQAKAASAAAGGPVAIFATYWFIVKTSMMLAVWFTGFLNVNLAMLNLLPIPVLDGGHICFSLWEWITRRPMHPKVVNGLVNAFAMILIGLILILTVRDVDRFTPVGPMVRNAFGAKEAASTNVMETVENIVNTNTVANPTSE
ncbi:MAG: regulator of sigma E protease [Candidatus Promineifilaceae bacterium]|jgi:regulator of sigma E protease